MSYVLPPPAIPAVPVKGRTEQFAVHRIYCVGRNYAAHAREMGANPQRELPFFFAKPADAIVPNHARIAYPSRTGNFHHEIELVVAIGKGGRDIAAAHALEHVYGYAVGIDLTRRDLQSDARDNGRPWDTSKGFDRSAPIGAIRPVSEGGHIETARIWLTVNGKPKQDANVAEMTWKVPEIIAELSTLFEVAAGDLIYTGTPAGVGPLVRGDAIEAGIDGLDSLSTRIV